MRSIFLALGFLAAAAADEQPTVTTNLGVLKGLKLKSISGREFYGFQGIPYAKPPIGKHRFKQSIPGTPWAGVLNATRLPSMCMQRRHPFLFKDTTFDVLGSEDCLYLNIYSPKLPSDLPDGKLLDVVFYIHGGAFQILSGDYWGPEHIMDRDVVYVNFNYRMGVLGFLSLEDKTCPGNNGLKDQNLALKWVNKHIAAFGGNPNSITVVGMSAGGASVHYQMLSPLSKGLFQKAIACSGTALNPWAITHKPRERALVIAESVGCPTNDSILILECLRDRPAEQVVASIKNLMAWGELPIDPMGPVIENPSATAFLDQQPIDAIRSKTINDVPVLFSHTNDEGIHFVLVMLSSEAQTVDLETKWDEIAKILYDYGDTADQSNVQDLPQIIRKHFLGDKTVAEALPSFSKSVSERWFVNGIQDAAILHAENQASPVYSYRFSYTGAEGFNLKFDGAGAPHGYDHNFVLKSKLAPPLENFPEAVSMIKTILDYYMDFITQTPVPSWETVKSGLPNFKFLDIVGPDPKKNLFKTVTPAGGQFWNSLGFHENSLDNIKSRQNSTHSEL